MIPFLYLPLTVLAALDILCLVRLPREGRRGLLWATVLLAVSAALLFPGEWALNARGLTWRTIPKELLCTVTWLSGLAAGVLTVWYVGRCPFPKEWLVPASRTLGALCLASAMLFGSVVGLLWAMGPGEQVTAYQGRQVVQGRFSWVGNVSYSLYEYHGPLVRGKEPLETWAE